jgi:hypothetical protein
VKVVCLGLRFIVGEVKSLRLRELCTIDDFKAQGRLSMRFQCTRLGFGICNWCLTSGVEMCGACELLGFDGTTSNIVRVLGVWMVHTDLIRSVYDWSGMNFFFLEVQMCFES